MRWLLRGAAFVVAAVVLYFAGSRVVTLFREHDIAWSDLTVWKPTVMPLLVSLALLITVYCMHALIWGRIVRDLHIGQPSAGTSLRIFFISGLARYIPIVKTVALGAVAVLSKRAGLPPLSSAAASVLGQFGFLTTGMLFLGSTLPEWRNAVEGGTAFPSALPLWVGAALLVVAALTVWVLIATPLGHGLRVWLTARLGTRAGERLGAAFALADRVTTRNAFTWAAAYAVSWVILGLAFLMFVGAFVPAAWEHWRLVAGTVAASYLLGYLVFVVPAGFGMREAVMIGLLSIVVPPAAAVVISVSSRIWFTAAELLPLLVLPLVSQPKLEREDG